MARKSSKAGSAKRYGTRYGRTNREKIGFIEAGQKKAHKCPYCRAPKVKRLAIGIWTCTKCNKTFTGKAYTVTMKNKSIPATAEKKTVITTEDE